MRRIRFTLAITSLGEATGAVRGLRDRFVHAHAAVLLDSHGRVLDLTIFTRANNTIDTAIGWADCMVANHEDATRIVLLSAVASDVEDELREADLATLRRAREVFAELGVMVVDWLQCDGKHVRCLDVAAGAAGWRAVAALAAPK